MTGTHTLFLRWDKLLYIQRNTTVSPGHVVTAINVLQRTVHCLQWSEVCGSQEGIQIVAVMYVYVAISSHGLHKYDRDPRDSWKHK